MTIPCPEAARDELLLPGFAVYASEENLEKYKDILIPEEKRTFSSETAQEVGNGSLAYSFITLVYIFGLDRILFRRLCGPP